MTDRVTARPGGSEGALGTSGDLDRSRRICAPGDEKSGRSPRRMHLVRKPLFEDPFSLDPVDSEDASSRRFAVAGVALAGGLVFGFVLSSLFRWSPYYWQWLAYHNGLVAAVITYLLVWASDERPRRRRIRRPAAQVRIATDAADVESIL